MKNRIFLIYALIACAFVRPVMAMQPSYAQKAKDGAQLALKWSWDNLGKPGLKGTVALTASLGVPAVAGAFTGVLTNALLAQKTGTNAFGIGVGAFVSALLLREGGHIIADGAYARMNGNVLVARYKNERDTIASLWRNTLDYLRYLKGQIQPLSGDQDQNPQIIQGKNVQVVQVGDQKKDQKSISKRVQIVTNLEKRINQIFKDYKDLYLEVEDILPYNKIILHTDLTAVGRVAPYCAQRAWYRYDRFFSGIMDHALTDAKLNPDFNKLETIFTSAVESIKGTKSNAPDVAADEAAELEKSVTGILNILEKNLAELHWKAKRLKWTIRIVEKFGW